MELVITRLQFPSSVHRRHPESLLSHQSKGAQKRRNNGRDYANFPSLHVVPKAMTLTELQQEATKADPTLMKLIQSEVEE